MKLVSWNTTKRCNLYCAHCYRDSSIEEDTSNELSLEEAKKVIEDIKKAGFQLLILSGGEPLLRPDIFEIAEYGTNQGLMVALGTNGTLIDEAMAKKIKETGIRSVAISLDSVDRETHNAFRGADFAYDKAIQGMKNLIEEGVKVQINITISKMNHGEIPELLDYCEELGASSVHVLFLVETGRGTKLEDIYLNRDEYEKALQEVLGYESDMFIKPTCAPQGVIIADQMGKGDRFTRGCLAGTNYCSILPDGQVHICPYAEVKAGDLRENSFYEIWNNSPVFQELREETEGTCQACYYNDRCGGCRARAYSQTGDYMEFDDYCLIHKD